jgi:hypothetical protein
MRLNQTHSSPLEAAEAGTQTVGHSPQGLQAFPGSPADAALGRTKQFPETCGNCGPNDGPQICRMHTFSGHPPMSLSVLPIRTISETHPCSQQKSSASVKEHFLAPQARGPRHARFSRGGVEVRAQLLPACPVLAAGTQRSGARTKNSVPNPSTALRAGSTALFSSRTSRPFVPQWN